MDWHEKLVQSLTNATMQAYWFEKLPPMSGVWDEAEA